MVKKISEARAFGGGGSGGGGGGDRERDDEDYERRGAYGGGPKEYLNGKVRPPVESEESEEEIREEAVEGQHLYLGFLYNQVEQEGLTLPPGLPVEDEVTLSPAQ